MTEREALKLTLAALKQIDEAMPFPVAKLAIMEAEKALAQPEQEPVGFTIQAEIDYAKNNPKEYAGFWANKDDDDEDWIALYTTPPQRTWVDLTDAEINDCMSMSIQKTCRAVEAKLKEKNT